MGSILVHLPWKDSLVELRADSENLRHLNIESKLVFAKSLTICVSFDRWKTILPTVIALKISSGSSLWRRSLSRQKKQLKHFWNVCIYCTAHCDSPWIQSFEFSILNQTLFDYVLRCLIFVQVVVWRIKVIVCVLAHLFVQGGSVSEELLWGDTCSTNNSVTLCLRSQIHSAARKLQLKV